MRRAALMDEKIPCSIPGTLQRVLTGVRFEALSEDHKSNLVEAFRGLSPEEGKDFLMAAGRFSEAEQQACPSCLGARLCI
ncbi:hypothetical protein CYMTET_49606 [Cymbomonas tetramitiformis]|uniref:Uncharacterized protein n=1 Tax=Cymbomonas tetramitiformis TaxID=36881 RepID=A0AAE0EUD8_9CHLO|nr:hypothetical protein CYMTET_49606 [Cymbomonas tetramitiformis]